MIIFSILRPLQLSLKCSSYETNWVFTTNFRHLCLRLTFWIIKCFIHNVCFNSIIIICSVLYIIISQDVVRVPLKVWITTIFTWITLLYCAISHELGHFMWCFTWITSLYVLFCKNYVTLCYFAWITLLYVSRLTLLCVSSLCL